MESGTFRRVRDHKLGSFGTVSAGFFAWKGFLPFLAKTGGALYVKDEKDDSAAWFFVE